MSVLKKLSGEAAAAVLGWAGGRQRVPGEEAASRRDTRQAAGGWVQAPGLGAEDARTHTHGHTRTDTRARAQPQTHARPRARGPRPPGREKSRDAKWGRCSKDPNDVKIQSLSTI